jgi:hypothetical protein
MKEVKINIELPLTDTITLMTYGFVL